MKKFNLSAVTGVTYGLLSALVIVVALGVLTAAGVGVENVFSLTGNTIAATMVNQSSNQIGSPNPSLSSEQQSEIANAAAEIAAGTASATCLQQMNNPANTASIASNGATCLGPGLNITPPQNPVKVIYPLSTAYPLFIYSDGEIYGEGSNGTVGESNLAASGLWFYTDGYVNNNDGSISCTTYANFYPGKLLLTTKNTSNSCSGSSAVSTSWQQFVTNASVAHPLGYINGYNW